GASSFRSWATADDRENPRHAVIIPIVRIRIRRLLERGSRGSRSRLNHSATGATRRSGRLWTHARPKPLHYVKFPGDPRAPGRSAPLARAIHAPPSDQGAAGAARVAVGLSTAAVGVRSAGHPPRR